MQLSSLETNEKSLKVSHSLQIVPVGQTNCTTNVTNVLQSQNDTSLQNIEGIRSTNTNKQHLAEQASWEDYEHEPVSGNIYNPKQKIPSQRMKLREHNIISNDKANARVPSHYKFKTSTTLILQTLIDQRHVGEFRNVVSKTKHSVVIHAHCYSTCRIYFIYGYAVKVYKLSSSVEKNNAICKLVQREFEHLLILKNQICFNTAPHPVHKSENVIVMSFIGSDQDTAPSISSLPLETLIVTYDNIVKEMEKWYKKLGLVHGNLSASNILYWMDKLYFIGWSHSVRKDHPMALKKLMKDCQFVTTFFKSKEVRVKSVEDLFTIITGLDKISGKVLEVLHEEDLWKTPQSNPNRDHVTRKTTWERFK